MSAHGPIVNDMDRIKRRIRSLINVAEDDAAAAGEIDNAMRFAQQMMDEHHLSRADVEAAQPEARRADEPMAKHETSSHGSRLLHWEIILANAVNDLVGSVDWFNSGRAMPVKVGAFGKIESRYGICFFGPAEDASLAVELYDEWSHVISTVAVGRYGGCVRGDGWRYACGFSDALHIRAHKTAQARSAIVNDSTRAIVRVGDGSLAQVLERKRTAATTWMAKEHGVRLSTRKVSGPEIEHEDAYRRGAKDGNVAEFSARRRPKLAAGSESRR